MCACQMTLIVAGRIYWLPGDKVAEKWMPLVDAFRLDSDESFVWTCLRTGMNGSWTFALPSETIPSPC